MTDTDFDSTGKPRRYFDYPSAHLNLLDGKTVARKSWEHGPCGGLRLEQTPAEGYFYTIPAPHLTYHSPTTPYQQTKRLWHPTHSDLLATDYYVV